MALNIENKKAIVKEVADVAAGALSLVAADYRGLTVEQVTGLRVKARQSGVYLRVVRNTLARRAVEGTDFACVQDSLVGPLILGFSQDEPGAAARLFRDFAKENEQFEVKLLSIGGKLLEVSHLQALASLPTRDEALAKLASVTQAPVVKLVRTLVEPYAQLVRTFAAIRDKKQAA